MVEGGIIRTTTTTSTDEELGTRGEEREKVHMIIVHFQKFIITVIIIIMIL